MVLTVSIPEGVNELAITVARPDTSGLLVWGNSFFHYDKKFRTSFCDIAFKNECSRITVEELRNANSSFPRRVDLMLQAGGRHFEYVL